MKDSIIKRVINVLIHISMQVRNFANWQICSDDCVTLCLLVCMLMPIFTMNLLRIMQNRLQCYWYFGGMHFMHKNSMCHNRHRRLCGLFFCSPFFDTHNTISWKLIWIDKPKWNQHSTCPILIRILDTFLCFGLCFVTTKKIAWSIWLNFESMQKIEISKINKMFF